MSTPLREAYHGRDVKATLFIRRRRSKRLISRYFVPCIMVGMMHGWPDPLCQRPDKPALMKIGPARDGGNLYCLLKPINAAHIRNAKGAQFGFGTP